MNNNSTSPFRFMWTPVCAAYRTIRWHTLNAMNKEAEKLVWKPLETIYVPHSVHGNSRRQSEREIEWVQNHSRPLAQSPPDLKYFRFFWKADVKSKRHYSIIFSFLLFSVDSESISACSMLFQLWFVAGVSAGAPPHDPQEDFDCRAALSALW